MDIIESLKIHQGKRIIALVQGYRIRGVIVAMHPNGILELKRMGEQILVQASEIKAIQYVGLWW